ncbi:bifunctional allantoicase/(S)-ureidoglycine aminohydrolase [Tabrizicola sp.]|uniref:bifunctional allantoicase/(S)-ureidoglycine aminohydrolase n=1 Tax=Tabrizicola sp. TaxID=2005166 RepID=UPI0035B0D1EF
MTEKHPGYYAPSGGLPPQTQLMTQRAVFTSAYAFIPKGCFSDIVTSYLPGWTRTKLWLIARPMSGFAETFSQYVMDVAPGGGSDAPDPDMGAEHWLFFTEGLATLTLDGTGYEMEAGSYAYIPAGSRWTLLAEGKSPARFHWLRKIYEPAPGVPSPDALVINERDVPVRWMPDTGERWGTTRFVEPDDLRHDAHVNIVTFQPGGVIPFEETHVMEHGLYVLEGKAVYKLNQDWVEVEAGDFMWLRAYCPQACYAAGPGRFRYLLYKDVNRHARLRGPGAFGPLK